MLTVGQRISMFSQFKIFSINLFYYHHDFQLNRFLKDLRSKKELYYYFHLIEHIEI